MNVKAKNVINSNHNITQTVKIKAETSGSSTRFYFQSGSSAFLLQVRFTDLELVLGQAVESTAASSFRLGCFVCE